MGIIYEPKGRAGEYAHLAINHYTGCDHNCTYCYVRTMPQWADKDFDATPAAPRENVLGKLRKDAPKFYGTDRRVLISFMGDPYCPIEAETQLTRGVLEILRQYDIPFTILTKGGTLAASDFDLYGPNDAFAATLTFVDEGRSRQYEPGAAIPRSRFLALEMAKAKGISTWVSLEPVIDADETLAVIKATHEFVDLYKIGKLNYQQSDINWWKFGINAINLCRQYMTDYYIKKDLAAHLIDVHFYNVDNRKVKRN